MTELEPAEGCLRVVQDDDPEKESMTLCQLGAQIAVERKSRLDDIHGFAKDGMDNDELALVCLRNIHRLSKAESDEHLLGTIDRDEVVVEIVKVLQGKMTADADMLCENALAIARLLTSNGWLVVKSGGVL